MATKRKRISPDTLVDESGLSARARNAIFRHCKEFGIDYVPGVTIKTLKIQDLKTLSLRKLKGFRGTGKKTILEIAEALEEAGIKLKESGDLELSYKTVGIYFSPYSKNGKVLLSLAKLLAENDPDIIITEED